MNKRPVFYVSLALLAVLALFGAPLAAVAHIDVSLKAASGPAGGTTPYSTKMTCGGCHFNCATGDYDDNRATWCQAQAEQKDCSVPGNCPDYASLATSLSSHNQGFSNTSGKIDFTTTTTKSPQHGASVGYHGQQGRNEETTSAQRTIWSAPAFISSPGMFGRYCMPSNRQLARKDFDPLNLDPAGKPREMEMGVPNFAKSCGVCHAGGGQMEFDRDMNEYSDTSPAGDRYTWLIPTASGADAPVNGHLVDVSTLTGNAKDRQLTGANKAELDCMMCHMSETRPSAAYFKNTLLCSGGNMVGPADNPNCGDTKVVFMDMKTGIPTMMPDNRFTFANGDFYDSYNRNIAVSYGYFGAAASAGLGAGVDLATGAVTGVPASILGSQIAGTPKSGNCAQCHARNEADNIGLPGEAQVFGGMIAGYGNFVRLTAAGQAFDWDKVNASGACTSNCTNETQWFEFGCKTGMGKRSQKTGYGSSDRWGNGFCLICDSQNQWADQASFCALPSVQADCIAKTGIPTLISDGSPMTLIDITAQGPMPKLVPGKMPDHDVHDVSSKNMTCSSCHYQLSGTIPARTISSGSTIYTYPTTSFVKMDHNMAKGYSMLEKAGDGFEGTVSCESCHIAGEQTNPNVAALNPPIAGHAGFPALHFEKIDCRTCHIPSIYATPGRLLFRDWTAGAYRQTEGSNGNANHFEFAINMLEGGMAPIRTTPMWITSPGGTKITPMQTNFLPIWAGSVQKLDNSVMWSPAKTRDINAAVAIVSAANPQFGIRINGTNDHPPFQGFQLTDPLKIESKAKIDAVATELASARMGVVAEHSALRDARINLFPLFYDTSHGVVDKSFALGSPSKGGCIMCHSSSAVNPMTGQPVDPATYSPKSVGFFDGSKDMLQNGMMQMANYDCDNPYLFTLMTTGQTTTLAAPTCVENSPITGLCDGSAYGTTSLGAQNGTMGLCKQQIGAGLAQQMGMTPDPNLRMDGVEFMQMMAIREGASAHNCNPMMQIFGLPTNCAPADYYSRAEIKLYFAKSMQQSFFTPAMAGQPWTDPVTGLASTVPSTLGRVYGVSAQIKKNPNNPAHVNMFDFGATCRNPLTGQKGLTCSEAMPGMTNLIDTSVSSNQLLGYDASQYAKLTNPATAGLQAPTAIVSYAKSGLTVNLDASGSVCPSGSCGYSWIFGDNTQNGTGVTAAHTYGAAGTYTTTLTVSDAVNATNDVTSVTFDVAAANSAPAAGFTSNLEDYGSPSFKTSHNWVVVLNDTSTDESTATLAISVNWGDGSIEPVKTGAGSSFSHTYVNAGSYTISYRVTDNGGMTATITQPVKIVKYLTGGKVTRSNGTTAVSSVKMDLKQGAAVVKTVYTNYLGNYAFTNLKPGTYTIVPSKTGLVFDVVPDVTVGADITTANISSTN